MDILCVALFTIAFTSPDNQTPSILTFLDMQDLMFNHLFADSDPNEILSISHNNPESPKCTWQGIKCDKDGVVTHISYIRFSPAQRAVFNLDLDWIPSTVKHLYLIELMLTGTVDTRKLPRDAEAIDLSVNQLEGTFDLRHLPVNLTMLHVLSNPFQSYMAFVDIPKNLQKLALSWSHCDDKVLLMGDLPDSLEKFIMTTKWPKIYFLYNKDDGKRQLLRIGVPNSCFQ